MDALRLFSQRLAARHHASPQEIKSIEHAEVVLREGLGLLARIGEAWHLALGSWPSQLEWPRVLFHATQAPNGRMVADEQELEELSRGGETWWVTAGEAQHNEGLRQQFIGRGGAKAGGTLVPQGTAQELGKTSSELIAEWRESLKDQTDESY